MKKLYVLGIGFLLICSSCKQGEVLEVGSSGSSDSNASTVKFNKASTVCDPLHAEAATSGTTDLTALINGSFESPTTATYEYNAVGGTWTFTGSSGVTRNGSAFTSSNPSAPVGVQVAFIQNSGYMTQDISISRGKYKVSLRTAQRANYQNGTQTLQILMDGIVVGQYSPTTSYFTTYTTPEFTVAANGVHSFRVLGAGSGGSDYTAFVDDFKVLEVVPATSVPQSSKKNGLRGRLAYLTANMPRFSNVNEIATAIDSGNDIFLSDLNVPTRMFDLGFPTKSGSTLEINGAPMFEWFGIDMQSEVGLTNSDDTGYYQFGLIADDGAVMELGSTSNTGQNATDVWATHINNDGLHSSRLGCATTTVQMARSTKLPIRVRYYQGPRTEIALMLIWRKVNSATPPAEALCGAVGQNYFFEYRNNPSTPQQPYQDLLSRGWKPVAPENFNIRGSQGGINPCKSDDNWAAVN